MCNDKFSNHLDKEEFQVNITFPAHHQMSVNTKSFKVNRFKNNTEK